MCFRHILADETRFGGFVGSFRTMLFSICVRCGIFVRIDVVVRTKARL